MPARDSSATPGRVIGSPQFQHDRSMRPILLALSLTAVAAPAAADVIVTHHIEGRFGVAYTTDSSGASHSQPLYEGRYVTTFQHEYDNGLRFRFELGVALGDLPYDRRGQPFPPARTRSN